MNDVQELDGRFGDSAPLPTLATQRPGQATMVEQARAIAEVRAAVMIAMDRPRDRTAAISEMREVCAIQSLADRAFFRVPRGGQHVNGESIHLARELARCWGNIDYGVKELARDDVRGQSELVAFAWDLQTNARSEITFIVPHTRGRNNTRLTGTQEIYENNASFAGRRLREAIFAVLPVWFKAEAAERCHETLKVGGGKPLIQRVADLRISFEDIGVTVAQLERKRGRLIDQFLPDDVGALRVIFGSLKRGEVTIAEEFPSDDPKPPAHTGDKLAALEQVVVAQSDRAFLVVDADGEEREYATGAEAVKAMEAAFEDAAKRGRPSLDAARENNTATLRELSDRGHDAVARGLAEQWTELMKGLDPFGLPPLTRQAPVHDAPERPAAIDNVGHDARQGDPTPAAQTDLLASPENLAVPLMRDPKPADLDFWQRQMEALIAENPSSQRRAAIKLQNEASLKRVKAVDPDRYQAMVAALYAKPEAK